MQSYADEILQLLEQEPGARVFPTFNKVPILPGNWKEYATADRMNIERTWTSHDVQVAMVIPDNMVVIDVDVKNGAPGEQSLRALMKAEPAFAKFIMNTRCHLTQSGGYHFFGITKPGTVISQKALAEGIDIRSQGRGYVVAPPTSGYVAVPEKEILELPEVFYSWRQRKEIASVSKGLDGSQALGLGLREHGGRNNALTSYLGKVWHYNGDFSRDAIMAIASNWNVRNCVELLSEAEVSKVVDSIMGRYSSFHTADDFDDAMCGLKLVRDPEGNAYMCRVSDGYRIAVTVSPRARRQLDGTFIKSPVDGELYSVSNLVRPIHQEVVPIRWLIPGLIPLRELTVLVGDSDVGKSYMMMGLSAYLTSGEFREYFPLSEVSEPRNIFYFTREDDEDSTVLGRLQAHNCDPERVIVMDRALTFSDFPELEGAIVKYRPALVVWDTAAMFLSGKTEMNDQRSVVQDLEPLLGLARKYDFAVVVIAHLRKDSKGTLKDRIMASIGFQTLARAAVAVTWKDAECEEQKTTRVVANIKGNLTKEVLAHEFVIDEQGKVQFQLSRASYGEMRKGTKDKAPSQQTLCDNWMRAKLSAGAVLNTRLIEEAEAHGFSKSHLSRARNKHHASVKRLEDGLFYTVPLLDEALSQARSQVAGL